MIRIPQAIFRHQLNWVSLPGQMHRKCLLDMMRKVWESGRQWEGERAKVSEVAAKQAVVGMWCGSIGLRMSGNGNLAKNMLTGDIEINSLSLFSLKPFQRKEELVSLLPEHPNTDKTNKLPQQFWPAMGTGWKTGDHVPFPAGNHCPPGNHCQIPAGTRLVTGWNTLSTLVTMYLFQPGQGWWWVAGSHCKISVGVAGRESCYIEVVNWKPSACVGAWQDLFLNSW